MKKDNKDVLARVWTFVCYPESLPDNWEDILINLHTPVVISPLHDKDVNPDGTPKKPHYHVLLQFDGKKSYSQILEFTKTLNSTIPQKVENIKGMVRYFIHLDNPEKYQYQKEMIRCFGGAYLEDYFVISYTEKYLALADMIKYINEHEIELYCDFVDYCREVHLYDWFSLLPLFGSVIQDYIKSLSFKNRKAREVFIKWLLLISSFLSGFLQSKGGIHASLLLLKNFVLFIFVFLWSELFS